MFSDKFKSTEEKLNLLNKLQENSVMIYHNPRCSKSREALKLLLNRESNVTIVEYLVKPMGFFELKNLLKLLGLTPREIIRTKENAYLELKLDNMNLSDKELITAMVKYPILIERPIVVKGEKAIIARPPERILDLL